MASGMSILLWASSGKNFSGDGFEHFDHGRLDVAAMGLVAGDMVSHAFEISPIGGQRDPHDETDVTVALFTRYGFDGFYQTVTEAMLTSGRQDGQAPQIEMALRVGIIEDAADCLTLNRGDNRATGFDFVADFIGCFEVRTGRRVEVTTKFLEAGDNQIGDERRVVREGSA